MTELNDLTEKLRGLNMLYKVAKTKQLLGKIENLQLMIHRIRIGL